MSRYYFLAPVSLLSFGIIALEPTGLVTNPVLVEFLNTIAYAFLGMSLLFFSFWFIDWILPADVEDEIFNKGNMAAAIFKGLFTLALAVIIAVVIIS